MRKNKHAYTKTPEQNAIQFQCFSYITSEKAWKDDSEVNTRLTQRMTKNMADDDERNRRKANPGQNKKPYWQETCIGVWTKSIKGHHVNSEADQDKICNGISVVRIYGKVRF